MSFTLELQDNIYNKKQESRHVVGLGDLSIDVLLEVQNKRCS
jgi:hypothetical protein